MTNVANFSNYSLEEAHHKLGKYCRQQIHALLLKQLTRLGEDRFTNEILQLKSVQNYLKLQNKQLSYLKYDINAYFSCLTSWTDGANIKSFIKKELGINTNISPTDLAFYLQRENYGCQTAILRGKEGRIFYWHTEEENKKLVTKSLIVSLKVNNQVINCFIYPHLLPGPAFTYSQTFFIGMDELYIKNNTTKSSMANAIAWLVIMNVNHTQKIIGSLLPTFNGYAANIVQKKHEKIYAQKYEFGGHNLEISTLQNSTKDYLFQVNLVTNQASKLATMNESIEKNEKEQMLQRIDRTYKYINNLDVEGTDIQILAQISQVLLTENGGNYAYKNKDVKAYIYGCLSRDGHTVRIGHPEQVKDEIINFKENSS